MPRNFFNKKSGAAFLLKRLALFKHVVVELWTGEDTLSRRVRYIVSYSYAQNGWYMNTSAIMYHVANMFVSKWPMFIQKALATLRNENSAVLSREIELFKH